MVGVIIVVAIIKFIFLAEFKKFHLLIFWIVILNVYFKTWDSLNFANIIAHLHFSNWFIKQTILNTLKLSHQAVQSLLNLQFSPFKKTN